MFLSFVFSFEHERGVGEGSALVYPKDILDTVRKLFPGDICDCKPQSRKVLETGLIEFRVFFEKTCRM